MTHDRPHPLAGKTTILIAGGFRNHPARVHDWRDRLKGAGWRISEEPSAQRYRLRREREGLPADEEVVAVTVGARNELVHDLELPQ